MRSRITELVSSGFVTDHASVRFDRVYGEYDEGARTVVLKLDEIEAFLTRSAAALRDTDAQLAARIG